MGLENLLNSHPFDSGNWPSDGHLPPHRESPEWAPVEYGGSQIIPLIQQMR